MAMKELFVPSAIISLLTQLIVSIAKWGAYPSHTADRWFSSLAYYVAIRLCVHLAALSILCLLVSSGVTVILQAFTNGISIKRQMNYVVLIVVMMMTELSVSWAEWLYLPDAFTEGWYNKSFIFLS